MDDDEIDYIALTNKVSVLINDVEHIRVRIDSIADNIGAIEENYGSKEDLQKLREEVQRVKERLSVVEDEDLMELLKMIHEADKKREMIARDQEFQDFRSNRRAEWIRSVVIALIGSILGLLTGLFVNYVIG